nr:host cell factor C1 regulator 1 [Anolis sagrei ordinatus]
MDPTPGDPSATLLPSSPPQRCSLLSGKRGWSHGRASSWQRDMTRKGTWFRTSQGVVNFSGTQRSRCRPGPLTFKRHLEHRDQEPNSKHFLSEDKMAARFNSLSLENDHIYSTNGFPIHDEDPQWQQAYSRLKELQQRLSQDRAQEETCSDDDDELNNVIVDGEYIMGECPLLTHPSLLRAGLGEVGITPEELLLSLNPCTEVVLWSPHNKSSLHTIRTMMGIPSSASASVEAQQKVVGAEEEMEV